MNFNLYESVKRVIKYLIEGIVVAIACVAIPQKNLQFDEIAIIALIAAVTFSVLDVFIPTMGQNSNQGRFGISGFPSGLHY